jgi:hypothetical protein
MFVQLAIIPIICKYFLAIVNGSDGFNNIMCDAPVHVKFGIRILAVIHKRGYAPVARGILCGSIAVVDYNSVRRRGVPISVIQFFFAQLFAFVLTDMVAVFEHDLGSIGSIGPFLARQCGKQPFTCPGDIGFCESYYAAYVTKQGVGDTRRTPCIWNAYTDPDALCDTDIGCVLKYI